MQASEAAAARAAARRFFAASGRDYDDVVRWATLFQDPRWKRAALRALPPGPADVLDYACGTGLLTLAAARRCAPGRVVGVDLSPDMLARARAKGEAMGAPVEWVRADAEAWEPPAAAFDAVLAGYLPKYVDPGRWLPRAARALRPGGVLVAYDFTYPGGRAQRAAWEAWWRFLGPRLGARPGWGEVAAELPAMVRGTGWVAAMRGALRGSGFGEQRWRSLAAGSAAMVVARREGP